MLWFGAVAALVIVAAVSIWWLNLPRSLFLTVQAVGQERHPVEFDVTFAGIDPAVTHVPVQLFYFPKTPIFGISTHYWSIIAPPRIDTVSRSLDVAVHGGRAHWTAPLGLAGLSNFRLQSVQFGEAGAPYALTASIDLDDPSKVDPSQAPPSLAIPLVAVTAGNIDYDGPVALWRRTEIRAPNPYAYAPRVDDLPAQFIWDGLRTLRARVDLAPYAMGTFVVPGGWEGAGWKNESYRLTRPRATLTDKALTLAQGVHVPLPFSRECESVPEFAIVDAKHLPAWSEIDGLWRPLPRATWSALRAGAQARDVAVRFGPSVAGRPSLDRVESFDIVVTAAGTYRLFVACPNAHYASLAVTWIDIVAAAPSRGS